MIKKSALIYYVKGVFLFVFLILSTNNSAQSKIATKSIFWQNVQFGGGLGLGFGSGYTDISLMPSAIYNFNEYAALGVGLQYKYLKQRDFYSSHIYGASVIGLFNPIDEVQLSAEIEQLRVNLSSRNINLYSSAPNYWNTALFLGAGYRSGNATVGVRYNLLTDRYSIYGSSLMPFVRIYF
jgi:hypothetical protein